MGTNYYLFEREPCECCGRPYDRLHIGKSSAGWCFSLHVVPEEGINDLPDWERRWARPGARIEDECGVALSADQMRSIITERSWPTRNRPADWYAGNHAEPGLNGLARHRIERGWCVGHGAGTWDLIPGEFS